MTKKGRQKTGIIYNKKREVMKSHDRKWHTGIEMLERNIVHFFHSTIFFYFKYAYISLVSRMLQNIYTKHHLITGHLIRIGTTTVVCRMNLLILAT